MTTHSHSSRPRATPGAEDPQGYRGAVACSAAGISYRQLDYWARTGLVTPSVKPAEGSGSQRLYSFRDIVVLKVVKRLLDAGISLQNIRKAVETLRAHGSQDLSNITLMSDGASVYECRSPEEVVDLLQAGQGVFGIALAGAVKDVEGTVTTLPSEPTSSHVAGVDELAARRARRAAG